MCKYNKFHIISTNLGVIFTLLALFWGLFFTFVVFLSSKRGAVYSAPTGIM